MNERITHSLETYHHVAQSQVQHEPEHWRAAAGTPVLLRRAQQQWYVAVDAGSYPRSQAPAPELFTSTGLTAVTRPLLTGRPPFTESGSKVHRQFRMAHE